MKISNLNSININDKLELPLNLKIGDLINARIIKILDNLITLKIENKYIVQAKDQSANLYNVGDKLQFVITYIGENKVEIKPYLDISQRLQEKLTLLDIKTNNDKDHLIDLLYKNNIPITKENINLIESTKKHYGKLATLLENLSSYNSNNLNVNTEIKDILKHLIKEYQFKTKEEISTKDNYQNSVKPDEIIIYDRTNLFSTNNMLAKEVVKAIKNISIEKLVFMFKNNLKFNLNNVKLIDNLLERNKTLTKQLENILPLLEKENIDSKNLGSIIKLFKKLNITNIKYKLNINEVYKDLIKELDLLRQNTKGKEVIQTVSRQIEELKSSIDFINKLNQNITFIQIPININNSFHNLDIFISRENKKSKKINKNDTNIFISLDTKNLDLVQILIKIKDKNIYLNFRLKHEFVRELISNLEERLSSKLRDLGFNNVFFKYNLSNKEMNLTNLPSLLNENFKFSNLDLRV